MNSTFRVEWSMEIKAATPVDAAREAHKILRNPGFRVNTFDVFNEDGDAERVDLDAALETRYWVVTLRYVDNGQIYTETASGPGMESDEAIDFVVRNCYLNNGAEFTAHGTDDELVSSFEDDISAVEVAGFIEDDHIEQENDHDS